MTSKGRTNNIDYFEKLPNIILHPTFDDLKKEYLICGKREILCGLYLQNKDTKE